MDLSHGFIPLALNASLSALDALAAGDGLRSDDLIAGAIALDLLASQGHYSHTRFNGLMTAVLGLRILATRQSISESQEGRRAATHFAAIVREMQNHLFN
nr:hypothetical protein 10.6 kDa [uncultured bacterium]